MCGLLSSSGVTRLLRYYETIRLPVPDFASLPLQLSGILPLQKESTGPPGCPCNPNVRHAMVSDPGEANIVLPLTPMLVLTSTSIKVLSFSSRHLRGSIPSTFRLTAYLLAVLRLKHVVANMPPKTRYPVAGQPSGTGFAPAGLHDLARPHNKSVPFFLTLTEMMVYLYSGQLEWGCILCNRPIQDHHSYQIS